MADVIYTSLINGGTTISANRVTGNFDMFANSPTADDAFYICASNPFYEFDISFATGNISIASTTHTLAYEYYNGSAWTALPSLTDGTSGLTTTGTISWTIPTDWFLWNMVTNVPAVPSATSAGYVVRVRLVSFTSITEGGRISSANYPGITQDYILCDTESTLTLDTIYNADVAGSWGVVEKDLTNFKFNTGLYFKDSTFTMNGGTLIIGGEGTNQVPFNMTNTTFNINKPASGYTLQKVAPTTIILGSRGTLLGAVYMKPVAGSIINSCSIKVLDENTYARLALDNDPTPSDSTSTNWFNCLFSKMICYKNHYFNRCNFQDLQYILTGGATSYINCFMNGIFSTDPGYDSVVERPIIDGRTTDTYYRGGVFPVDGRQNRFDIVSGTFLKNFKYYNWQKEANINRNNNYQQYIAILSNYLHFTSKDRTGNDIVSKLYITDAYGNNMAWQETDLEIRSGLTTYFPQSATDTTLELVDATDVETGDQYLCFGEIFTVQSKTGNVLTITRGDENSARRIRSSSNLNTGVKLRKRVPYLEIDGTLDNVYIIEQNWFKYTVDAGTTTTGHIENNHIPYLLKVEADGYETWTYNGNITSETTFNIILRPQKQLAITNDGVYVNTDPKNKTDTLSLIKI
jgi:hypothetical protein